MNLQGLEIPSSMQFALAGLFIENRRVIVFPLIRGLLFNIDIVRGGTKTKNLLLK